MAYFANPQYWAGLFDGEGNIGLIPSGNKNGERYLQVRIQLCGNYKPTIQTLADIFQVNVLHEKRQPMMNKFALVGKKAVAFLEEILPFLKEKEIQARYAIQFQYGRTRYNGGCKRGISEDELAWRTMHKELIKLENQRYKYHRWKG